ncbi:MAG TPA: alpha/beta hydrolase [Candidatus Elarobacter sp.]|jgi:pimeloyl-ACP methyl ester carboxylesterase
MHYTDDGAGTPIVLLHGNGVTNLDWRTSGVLELLAREHRVLAFDRPGFGYSDRPRGTVWTPEQQAMLVHEALQQLDAPNAIVVGHSWGTLVALALALNHTADVRRLVLLSGYYFPTARLDVPISSAPAIPVLGDVLRYTASPVLGRLTAPLLVAQLFAPLPVPERFARFPLSMALRPSQLRANAEDTALMVPSARGLAERYTDLAVPVAIVTGDEDQIVSPSAQSERLAQTVPGSTLRSIAGAGHMVHYAAPELVAQTITRDGMLVA